MQTPIISARANFTVRILLVTALFVTPAFFTHAQSEASSEKKQLELRQKELELKKKEIDLQKQQLQLDAAKKELQMKETEKNVTINLQGDVAFDSGKAALRAEGEMSLEKVAVVISQFPESKVLIAGFTDNKGGKEANLRLSEKRAEAVRDWLVKRGVKAMTITTKGYGEEQPVALNQVAGGLDNPEGRQQNRRVEITVQK